MKQQSHNNQDIVVAVDIGTTKVCAIAGLRDAHGRIEILAVGKEKSNGVLRGVVSNIDKTVKAIKKAIDKVSHSVPFPIKEVHLGIAGQHIKSLQNQGILVRDDAQKEITQEDIDKLIEDMHKIGLPAGKKILHIIPQEYTVDNESGIDDPIGMSGSSLKTDFHIITGQVTAFNNLERCMDKARLSVRSLILEPIASAMSVVTEKELEAGIALVDLGGGTTDLAIFHEGILRHTAVIPLGGNIVTNDIKEGCTVMRDQAEKLKVKFGSALADEIVDNRTIIIPGLQRHDEKNVSERNLARIIQARVEEILDYVYSEIIRSGYEDKLIGGIVLTGGGALLRNIKELTELQTGQKARIGLPSEYLAHGYGKEMSNPAYATAIGLLIKGISRREKEQEKAEELAIEQQAELPLNHEKPVENETESHIEKEEQVQQPAQRKKRSRFNKTLERLKDFFEPAPDSQL